MTDGATFVAGGVTYPLTSSTTNSLLHDADPALFTALAYFKSVLNTHLGPRMLAEAARLNLALMGAVAYTTNVDPGKHPIDTRYRFPLLAVYRRKTKYGYRTLNWAHGESTWGITYLLPVMSTLQAETFSAILKSVADILSNRIEQGFDPAYNNGEKIWQTSGIEKISFDDDEYGVFVVPEGTQFFAGWTGTLVVTERTMPVTNLERLAGVDAAEDLVSSDGSDTITDFVDFKSDIAKPGPATG